MPDLTLAALISGNPAGQSMLAKTAVGVGIVLLARGIMS